MSKFKKYERYKDSGVEWIGEIPEHWEKMSLKMLASNEKNSFVDGPFGSDLKNEEYQDDGIPLIQLNNIVDGKHILQNLKYISEEKAQELCRHVIYPNDIVIAKMAYPVARAARVNEEYDKYVIVADCVRLRPNITKCDVRFLVYVINCPYVRSQAEIVASGTTRLRISLGSLKNLQVFLPTLDEQKSIADYLDQKTAKIDGLIADKEKLIELLQEKRQAIISEAVTKGLNPNIRMKDSGVEWIGEIPEHWEIIPLKYITNFISRGNSPEYVEESSIKVINQACIYWDELKIENVKYQYDDIDFDKLKGKLIKGDLLLNSTGTGTLGRAVVFREDGNYMADSHVTIIRFNKMKMDEFFAFYILQTQIYQGYIYNALVTGATNQIELSRERLTATPMIVPPSTEQQEIVNFLDAKIGQIAILINEIKIQIEKLKEYRQSLISEAVTGKIDVRDYKDEEMSNLNLIKKVERRVSKMKNETIYLDRDMNQRFEKEFEAAKKDWEKGKQEYEKQKRDNDKKQF